MMNRRYDGIDKDDGPSYGMASVGEPVGVLLAPCDAAFDR